MSKGTEVETGTLSGEQVVTTLSAFVKYWSSTLRFSGWGLRITLTNNRFTGEKVYCPGTQEPTKGSRGLLK